MECCDISEDLREARKRCQRTNCIYSNNNIYIDFLNKVSNIIRRHIDYHILSYSLVSSLSIFGFIPI